MADVILLNDSHRRTDAARQDYELACLEFNMIVEAYNPLNRKHVELFNIALERRASAWANWFQLVHRL